ncbi:hypothetical protein KI387_018854, partial [Taxus chinensis]
CNSFGKELRVSFENETHSVEVSIHTASIGGWIVKSGKDSYEQEPCGYVNEAISKREVGATFHLCWSSILRLEEEETKLRKDPRMTLYMYGA